MCTNIERPSPSALSYTQLEGTHWISKEPPSTRWRFFTVTLLQKTPQYRWRSRHRFIKHLNSVLSIVSLPVCINQWEQGKTYEKKNVKIIFKHNDIWISNVQVQILSSTSQYTCGFQYIHPMENVPLIHKKQSTQSKGQHWQIGKIVTPYGNGNFFQ